MYFWLRVSKAKIECSRHVFAAKTHRLTIVKLRSRSRSRSSQGPFLVHSRFILSHSNLLFYSFNQNQMIWTRSWCYFHCVTTHQPGNFSRGDPEPKPIQTDFWPCHLDNTMKTGVLNIPAPVRMTPVLLDSNSRLCGWGSSWQGNWHFGESSV